LRYHQAAVAALYSDDMMDGFYRDSPAFTSMNQEAAKYFKSLVSLSSFGRRRPLRVLEIGAGLHIDFVSMAISLTRSLGTQVSVD
jgi:hypothetical protein